MSEEKAVKEIMEDVIRYATYENLMKKGQSENDPVKRATGI
jgi:hypothetical protein